MRKVWKSSEDMGKWVIGSLIEMVCYLERKIKGQTTPFCQGVLGLQD